MDILIHTASTFQTIFLHQLLELKFYPILRAPVQIRDQLLSPDQTLLREACLGAADGQVQTRLTGRNLCSRGQLTGGVATASSRGSSHDTRGGV